MFRTGSFGSVELIKIFRLLRLQSTPVVLVMRRIVMLTGPVPHGPSFTGPVNATDCCTTLSPSPKNRTVPLPSQYAAIV